MRIIVKIKIYFNKINLIKMKIVGYKMIPIILLNYILKNNNNKTNKLLFNIMFKIKIYIIKTFSCNNKNKKIMNKKL